MTAHTQHQIQITSLFQYSQVNSKFRNKMHTQIILMLQKNYSMTDREMQYELGLKERNNISPRRHELVNGLKRKDSIVVPDSIVIQDEIRLCKVCDKHCISWKLNPEKLQAWMGE